MLNKKKILITGGLGYIGLQLNEILKNTYKVYNVDINGENTKNNLKLNFNSNKVVNLIQKNNIKIIIHLAADTNVIQGEKNKEKFLKNNYYDVKDFFYKLNKSNIKLEKFIFASSAAIYKSSKNLLTEKSIIKPLSVYGKSKLYTEKFLKSKVTNVNNILILRFFNVAGGKFFLKFSKTTFFHNIALAIKKNNIFTVFGSNFSTKDGYAVRDFIHVNDLAIIIKKLLKIRHKKKINIFNISGGHPQSLIDIINQVKKIKKTFVYKTKKSRPAEIAISKSSNLKLLNYLKIKKFKDPVQRIIKDIT